MSVRRSSTVNEKIDALLEQVRKEGMEVRGTGGDEEVRAKGRMRLYGEWEGEGGREGGEGEIPERGLTTNTTGTNSISQA